MKGTNPVKINSVKCILPKKAQEVLDKCLAVRLCADHVTEDLLGRACLELEVDPRLRDLSSQLPTGIVECPPSDGNDRL